MTLQFKTRHCNGILLRGFDVSFKGLSPLHVAIWYFSFKHKRQRLLFGL